MNITVLFHIIIVLEMIFINSYIIHLCSKRKKGKVITLGSFFLTTVFIISGMMAILMQGSSYGNGNGLFVLAGFIYLIPCHFIFDQPMKYSVTVICSSWIYTMLLFCFAVRIGYMLPQYDFAATVLIAQTIAYLLTFKVFISFVKKRFIYMVKNITPHTANQLLSLCLIWFFSLVILNFVFVMDHLQFPKLLLVIILFINVFTCYNVFYSLVSSHKATEYLEAKNRTDPLTQLGNRFGFFEDAQTYIDKGEGFSIFYMDLNNFKRINDQYGHPVGDLYLIHFSSIVQNTLHTSGDLYRLSGDEFVFLSSYHSTNYIYHQLTSITIPACENKYPFLGYSVGLASYPLDGSTLESVLNMADSRMYEHKNSSKNQEHSHS